MHHPIDRITHTMAFVTPVVEHWLENLNNLKTCPRLELVPRCKYSLLLIQQQHHLKYRRKLLQTDISFKVLYPADVWLSEMESSQKATGDLLFFKYFLYQYKMCSVLILLLVSAPSLCNDSFVCLRDPGCYAAMTSASVRDTQIHSVMW